MSVARLHKRATKKAANAGIRPCIRIVSEPEIPDILYKYTNDAGVAGLREGIIRFGSFEEYRDAENEAIRDRFENSLVSSPVPVYSPDEDRVSLVLALRSPGVVFCASADDALCGAFGYSRRVAIKSKPFIRALTGAAASVRHIFDAKTMTERREIVAARFSESDPITQDKGQWRPVRPKEYKVQLCWGRVRYPRNAYSKIPLRRMLTAAAIGGDVGMKILHEEMLKEDMVMLRKPAEFSHERECRVALNFLPWGAAASQDVVSAYIVNSLFVKLDNPREIFIFGDN